MSPFEKALEATQLITRAEQGRARAWSALRKMRRQTKSINALRDYVAAAAMVEESELALLKITWELGK